MERTCRIGVHGRNDTSFVEDDYRVIADSHVEAVKMMSQTESAVFARIKEIDGDIEIITRLYDDRIGDSHPTPVQYAEKLVPVMQGLQPYCHKYQVANEPNHVQRYEGWGAEDADAESFNAWFLEVYRLLKQACPWASIGFPGLAVPDFAHRDRAWLDICRPAIERADWLGVHCYWQTPTDRPSVMFDEHFGKTFAYYHRQFPDKTLEILECGNSNVHNPDWPISQDDIAREYVTWLQEVFRFPYVNSAAFFLLSSQDVQNWEFFSWRTENNFVKPVVHAIGAMNRPPLVQTTTTTPEPSPAETTPPPAVPADTSGMRMDGRFSNNQIIDAFYDASVKLGLGDWTLLTRAGLSLDTLVADRTGAYAGPSLEEIGDLNEAERQALRAELADFDTSAVPFGPGEVEPLGLLWQRPNLAVILPRMPATMQRPLSSATSSRERRVLRTWNGYGWLIFRVCELLHLRSDATLAALAVYCSHRAFDGDGRLGIRFEPHIFYAKWGADHVDDFHRFFRFHPKRPWQRHEWRPAANQPFRDVHATLSDEWGAFELARELDAESALLATGMGAAMIMGFNHALVGFESAGQMYDAFRGSARNQVLAFFDFIGDPVRITPAIHALQSGDLASFAAMMSGPDQAARAVEELTLAAESVRSLGLAK